MKKLNLVNIVYLLAIVMIILFIILGMAQIRSPKLKISEQYERAIKQLEAITAVPHASGSEAKIAVKDYIINQIEEMGLTAEIQNTSLTAEEIKHILDTRRPNVNHKIEDIMERAFFADEKLPLEDIYVLIEGQKSDIIGVVAHYDSVKKSPGAGDDGISVVSVLEAMRAVAAGEKLVNSMLFLLTDGEEQGLLGAHQFLKESSLTDRIKYVINFEMRGNAGIPIMFETSSNNYGMLNLLKNEAYVPVAFSFASQVYNAMPNDTDFTEFKNYGIKGIGFAAIENLSAYHQETDTVENLDKNLAAHFIKLVPSLANALSIKDLTELNSEDSAIFFPFLRGNLVVYPLGFAVPIAIITLLAAIVFTGFLFFKKKISVVKVCVGFFAPLVISSVPFAVSYGILSFTSWQVGSVMINILEIFAPFWIFGVLCVFRKKIDSTGLFIGLTLLFSVLGVVTAFVFSGISYAFYHMAQAILISSTLIIVSARFGNTVKMILRFLAFIIAAFVISLLWTPIVHLLIVSLPNMFFVSIFLETLVLIAPIALLMGILKTDRMKEIKEFIEI